jgi:hypothetical protein
MQMRKRLEREKDTHQQVQEDALLQCVHTQVHVPGTLDTEVVHGSTQTETDSGFISEMLAEKPDMKVNSLACIFTINVHEYVYMVACVCT